MPRYRIDKSISINKSPEELTNLLDNFNGWMPWSPWQIVEKEARVNISDDGKFYEWEGQIIGSGNMDVVSVDPGKKIEYNLTFLKPWKSKSKIYFEFIEKEVGTEVHWIMESSLPFFLFFMKKMMEAYLGMDFDRGLKMLKEYAEFGIVHSELTFNGPREFAGCQYIGIKTNCSFDEIDTCMERDFTTLMEFIRNGNEKYMAGNAMSIYHKWQIVKRRLVYTACVPVNGIPDSLPSNVFVGEIPPCKVYAIHHKGPFEYIGNAWSAQYSRKQAKFFKVNKRIDPIEVYHNSPKDTATNDLEADILMPIL